MTEEILDPFADETADRETELGDRLSEIDGSRLGMFSNAKKNADTFLRCLGEQLEASHDVEVSDVIYKQMSPSAADEEVYERLQEYDAVLIAYGDCGSCSSWTIHDALQLEQRGVPTVVYCTEEFTTLCQYESENQGAPGLPIVQLGHPIADLDEEAVASRRVTEAILDQTVEALTASVADLRERYAGRYTDTSSGAV